MAYTPINWQTGDTITADKLNRCDNGWGVESTQLFSETVTTSQAQFGIEGILSYSGQVTNPSITVTFDGTEYTCSAVQLETAEGYGYGGVTSEWKYDFTTYPFALVFSPSDGNVLATQTAGTYVVAVNGQGIVISDNFNAAVNACVDTSYMPMRCTSGSTTYPEMSDAVDEGRPMFFIADYRYFFITQVVSNGISFIPESSHVAASFVNDVFTVTIS